MTITEKSRLAGFSANLKVRGRAVVVQPDNRSLTVLLLGQEQMPDPTDEAKARTPVYCLIHARAGCVPDPRTVTRFEETAQYHQVIEFREKSDDRVIWTWFCETQRRDFTANPITE